MRDNETSVPSTNWPLWLNCLVPMFAVGIAAIGAYFAAGNILANAVFGMPAVWLAVPLLAACIGAIFQSHFNASVDNRIVWPAIAVSGFALILFFAFLHREDGIICTAPICPDAHDLAQDDPRFTAKLGEPLPPLTPTNDVALEDAVALNTDVKTALYFSMVTFTTLGYGDFQPTPRMRLIASFEALIGYAFLGLMVGLLVDLGSRKSASRVISTKTGVRIIRQRPRRGSTRSQRPRRSTRKR